MLCTSRFLKQEILKKRRKTSCLFRFFGGLLKFLCTGIQQVAVFMQTLHFCLPHYFMTDKHLELKMAKKNIFNDKTLKHIRIWLQFIYIC